MEEQIELTEMEKKKEYLKSYERAVRRRKREAEKIEELRLAQMIPAQGNDGMPHAHNCTDLSGYAAMLEEAEKRYKKTRYECGKLCKEITDKIERLQSDDEKDVLMYRYIRRMSWEDVCVKLKHSWQHTHRIHKRALENFKM